MAIDHRKSEDSLLFVALAVFSPHVGEKIMATKNHWLPAILLVLSCAASMRAQEPEDVIRNNTNLVTINVSVNGNKGQPVAGLRQENFLVTEQEKQMRVEFFDNSGPPALCLWSIYRLQCEVRSGKV
jgi:hypothetical protein